MKEYENLERIGFDEYVEDYQIKRGLIKPKFFFKEKRRPRYIPFGLPNRNHMQVCKNTWNHLVIHLHCLYNSN